jgi:hypothetical protein
MKYLTGILAGIFIFVAMFGFIFTDHTLAATHGAHEQSVDGDNCIIAMMGLCSTDGLSMVEHHLLAYQSFLNTPASSFFSISLALICLGLVSVYITLLQSNKQLAFQTLSHRTRLRASSYSDFQHKKTISHWLSLFETSPTLN